MSEPMPLDRWPTWAKVAAGVVVLCLALILVMSLVGCQHSEPEAASVTPARAALEDLTGGTHQRREAQQANLFTEGAVMLYDMNTGIVLMNGCDERVQRLNEDGFKHIASLYGRTP